MGFVRGRFLGLTLKDFKTSVGWGSQAGQLEVELVRDPANGDAPSVPPVGWPVYFQFEGLRFNGLLQHFGPKESPAGQVYTATVVDPREILDGAVLVTSNYAGAVGGLKNLVNVYGWWEAQGYGLSGSTPAGMPWANVATALRAICNTPGYGPFGGPLNYKGVAYALDLSEIPTPPPYYRIAGGHAGLLEVVTQLCEDAGCDFHVDLVGYTIRVRAVSRAHQPPLGTLSALALSEAFSGRVLRVEAGVEARNETTSAFVVGGEVTELFLTQAAASFWGYDIVGNPIVGEPGPHPGLPGTHDFMSLNAAGVADIIGSTYYPCNTVEIRCAMQSYECWSVYLKKYRQPVFNLVHGLWNKGVPDPSCKADLIDDSAAAALRAANADLYARSQRLYEFVRAYGTDFYGKQFLVRLPFVLAKQDDETLVVTYSQEPTDAGYLPDGADALGLSPQNQEAFLAPDERVLPFAFWPTVTAADTSRANWNDTVIEQDNSMYMKASVNPKMVFIGDVPCALVQLSGALYEKPADQFGGQQILNPLLADGQPGRVQAVANNGIAGTIGVFRVWPAALPPAIFAVALKSNVEHYGPWYVAGAPGKVRFEYDPSLTPWDYGGHATMNLAGNARVLAAVTNMQAAEAGTVEVAGAPEYSLGDVLQAGGPNLTAVNVSFGPDGVTTAYRFQTFTPRFGLFSRQNAERLKRMGLAAVEQRKTLRRALNRQLAALHTADAAVRGFLANAPKYVKRESPHDVLMVRSIVSGQDVRPFASTETYEAAIPMCRPEDSGAFQGTAVMSLSGLVRGFGTKPGATGSVLPNFASPTGSVGPGLTCDSYHPFPPSHDVEVVTQGDTYQGLHAYRNGASTFNTRAVGLRGPVTVVGWGYGIDGVPYPGNGSGGYAANTPRRSDLHKAGPVDLLWDNWRGVWTSHDLVTAQIPSGVTLPARSGGGGHGGPVNMRVGGSAASGGGSWVLPVYNRFNVAIAGPKEVIAGYCLNENKFFVVAADC
jgi:hypothetical protein